MSLLCRGCLRELYLILPFLSKNGLLEKLERGDSVMADKDFDIQHLLVSRGVRLNIPPF